MSLSIADEPPRRSQKDRERQRERERDMRQRDRERERERVIERQRQQWREEDLARERRRQKRSRKREISGEWSGKTARPRSGEIDRPERTTTTRQNTISFTKWAAVTPPTTHGSRQTASTNVKNWEPQALIKAADLMATYETKVPNPVSIAYRAPSSTASSVTVRPSHLEDRKSIHTVSSRGWERSSSVLTPPPTIYSSSSTIRSGSALRKNMISPAPSDSFSDLLSFCQPDVVDGPEMDDLDETESDESEDSDFDEKLSDEEPFDVKGSTTCEGKDLVLESGLAPRYNQKDISFWLQEIDIRGAQEAGTQIHRDQTPSPSRPEKRVQTDISMQSTVRPLQLREERILENLQSDLVNISGCQAFTEAFETLVLERNLIHKIMKQENSMPDFLPYSKRDKGAELANRSRKNTSVGGNDYSNDIEAADRATMFDQTKIGVDMLCQQQYEAAKEPLGKALNASAMLPQNKSELERGRDIYRRWFNSPKSHTDEFHRDPEARDNWTDFQSLSLMLAKTEIYLYLAYASGRTGDDLGLCEYLAQAIRCCPETNSCLQLGLLQGMAIHGNDYLGQIVTSPESDLLTKCRMDSIRLENKTVKDPMIKGLRPRKFACYSFPAFMTRPSTRNLLTHILKPNILPRRDKTKGRFTHGLMIIANTEFIKHFVRNDLTHVASFPKMLRSISVYRLCGNFSYLDTSAKGGMSRIDYIQLVRLNLACMYGLKSGHFMQKADGSFGLRTRPDVFYKQNYSSIPWTPGRWRAFPLDYGYENDLLSNLEGPLISKINPSHYLTANEKQQVWEICRIDPLTARVRQRFPSAHHALYEVGDRVQLESRFVHLDDRVMYRAINLSTGHRIELYPSEVRHLPYESSKRKIEWLGSMRAEVPRGISRIEEIVRLKGPLTISYRDVFPVCNCARPVRLSPPATLTCPPFHTCPICKKPICLLNAIGRCLVYRDIEAAVQLFKEGTSESQYCNLPDLIKHADYLRLGQKSQVKPGLTLS